MATALFPGQSVQERMRDAEMACKKCAKDIESGDIESITRMLREFPEMSTKKMVRPFIVHVATDQQEDIRALPGFVPVDQYGSLRPINEMEIGAVESFRFVNGKSDVDLLRDALREARGDGDGGS